MIRFGIVGAGKMAYPHVRAIQKHPDCELIAVADIVRENALAVVKDRDVAIFEDYRDMCRECELDAVIINLPHFLHCEATCHFLENGVNVFVEKPMAINVEECDKMIAAARDNNVKLAVGHVQQYAAAHKYLRDFVKSKKYGELLRITETRNGNYFENRSAWFLDKKLAGGGIVMNLGAHTLDKVMYVTDSKLEKACAVCKNTVNDYTIEEGAQVLAKFSCGASAVFSFTGVTNAHLYETYYYFEKSVFKVAGGLALYEFDDEKKDWVEIVCDPGTVLHDGAIEEFVKLLKGEPSEVTTPEYGRNVIEGLTMIFNSQL